MMDEVRQLASAAFPPLLHEITDPPKTLFIRGNLPPEETLLLAVVGSRSYSPYGRDVCEALISGLDGLPVAIVSGLAIGMDAIAHRAALQNNILTVAVPGSGLSDTVLYPRVHTTLAREIIEHSGCLLSEFPPDFRATPYSFPQRNRIMAGMSCATLVIEAAEKSGTLITARLAMEYNRDVLTVPQSIFSKNSWGPHMLIKNGATPITSPEDLRNALGFTAETQKTLRELSPNEQKVYDILLHPMSKDDLIEKLEMDISAAQVLISAMELKGLIIERMGEIRVT